MIEPFFLPLSSDGSPAENTSTSNIVEDRIAADSDDDTSMSYLRRIEELNRDRQTAALRGDGSDGDDQDDHGATPHRPSYDDTVRDVI